MEHNKTISALLGVEGYKAVAVVSISVVGIYAAKKFVDKLASASIIINADSKNPVSSK